MDVAVRIGPLPDSGLKALRVGRVRRMLCASPEYLARHGVPKHPSTWPGMRSSPPACRRGPLALRVTDEPTLCA
jgi:DNA-binding transcriptional LysR family regulator